MPLVSVVLPVYGYSKYLKESIDSILNQSLKDLELIIVEDPKENKFENEKLIKSYKDKRIKYIRNKSKLGLVNSLNIGISISNSKYIARQDADDISLPDRLLKQYNFLNEKKAAVVGGSMVIIDEKGNTKGYRKYPTDYLTIKKNILLRDLIAHPTVMFDKKVISSLGNYNFKMLHVEDYDLWLKIINKEYKIYNLQDYLIKYRYHKETIKYKHFKETLKNTIKLQLRAIKEYKNINIPLSFPLYLLAELILLILPTKIGYFLFEKFSVK